MQLISAGAPAEIFGQRGTIGDGSHFTIKDIQYHWKKLQNVLSCPKAKLNVHNALVGHP
jgi:hypothetical protein